MTIASRVLLAVAILYFAYQLARIVDSGPQIRQTLDGVTKQLPDALATIDKTRLEIAEIRQTIPGILQEVAAVRLQIPPILREVEQLRQSLPLVLKEVEQTRRQLPALLNSVDNAVSVVDRTQQQFPDMLAAASRFADTVDSTNEQLGRLTPEVLEEVRLIRQKIDPTLDRVEVIVDDTYRKAKDAVTTAEGAGQEASEGAITGLVTGILKLPFRLLGTIAAPILDTIRSDVRDKLTQEDVELMGEAGDRLAKSRALNKPEHWNNPSSGNRGSITLTRRYRQDDLECVEARITFNLADQTSSNELERFCRNEDGKWTLAPDDS